MAKSRIDRSGEGGTRVAIRLTPPASLSATPRACVELWRVAFQWGRQRSRGGLSCGAGCACVVGQRGGLERRGGGATAEVQMPDQCVRQVFGHAVGRRIRFGREAAMSLLLCLGGALEAEVARILSKSDPVVGIARRCADRAEVVTAAEAGVGSVAVLREWDLKLSKVSIGGGLL